MTVTPVTVPTVNRKLGNGDTGFSVDMRLRLDKPLGTIYLSTEPRGIKVASTAPNEITRADEIAIETAKTGKVTAVVAVMSIFSKKRCKLQRANCGNEKPSCQKVKSANFLDENTHGSRNLSQKSRKGWIPKELAPKLNKLELNCTNLELIAKRRAQIAPKRLIQALALD